MHGDLSLGGPVYWFVVLLGAFVLLGALAIFVDVLRRPGGHVGRFGRAWYPGLSAVFVLHTLAVFFLPVPSWVTAAFGFVFAAMLVTEFVYLLRVVFPSPARLQARHAGHPAGEKSSEDSPDAPGASPVSPSSSLRPEE